MTTKFRDQQSFNHLQMEAALCAWEWMLENNTHEIFNGMFDSHGYGAMRHCAMQAGDIANLVYKHMEVRGYEFVDAYDWEFVPGVLLRLDWEKLFMDNQYNEEPYQPDIHAIFCAMVSADLAAHTDPQRRSFQKKEDTAIWITKARAEAEKQWGYSDLVSDHPEKVTAAMERDEDPAEFIKWLGEKYNLTPAPGL
ncbi:hypothetical protein [Ochrobactrum soli]|uniref:Uncharacterized protein n=1 Tax=Ochrobactrum soli TaxID=2448455 RepID=A0A2P9HMS1_9HYPH|nr:hypothetical protein [[Ochrobactrum] soli]SPL65386.1 hypothetical protein OHAE_1253 [[Ochrobactrum] soli]